MSRGLAKKHCDYWLLCVILILVTWGFLTLGLVSFPLSLKQFGNPWYYLFRQAMMLGIGFLLGFILFKIPSAKLQKLAFPVFILNFIMLFLVFLPFLGVKLKGSHRWLNFGLFISQPSELLKLTFILYLSAWLYSRRNLTEKRDRRARKPIFRKLLVPFFAILALLIIVLMKQPDMSTLAIICLTGLIMYFLAKTPIWQTGLILVLGALIGFILINTAQYRALRFSIFLNPDVDALGAGYHLKQSLIAVGSGKLFGIDKGFSLGLSRQKFGFLPDPITDSIFAIIGEELGFFGSILLLLLFLVFCWHGFKIARKKGNSFEGLTAGGITFWLTFQALLNIGGIIGVFPIAGVPLPFFSYGGSHIITELMAVGVLLNISRSHI